VLQVSGSEHVCRTQRFVVAIIHKSIASDGHCKLQFKFRTIRRIWAPDSFDSVAPPAEFTKRPIPTGRNREALLKIVRAFDVLAADALASLGVCCTMFTAFAVTTPFLETVVRYISSRDPQ
jgi:hypothetical protein